MNHIDRMKEIRNKKAQIADELKKLTFSACINFESLSLNDLNDLAALQIGESTYVLDGEGETLKGFDITRTA